MSKDRGFKKLIDKTIISINAKAVNEVLLEAADGSFYVIQAEILPPGIPHITLEKFKNVKYELPERRLKPSAKTSTKEKPWPFPPTEDSSLD